MKPIGFVKSNIYHLDIFIEGKIYPYYRKEWVNGYDGNSDDCAISILTEEGNVWAGTLMYLGKKPTNQHHFDFYHYPEFPKDINKWTEDDWFQYHLKYGE